MGDTRRHQLPVILAILAALAVGFAAPASASFTTLAPAPLTAAPTTASSLAASVQTPTSFTGARLSWSRTPTGARPYVGARYYGSKIARFTTVDPVYTWNENLLDPQRWNRYAYARNNPVKYTDPDGRVIKLAVYAYRIGRALYRGQDAYSTVSTIVTDAQTIGSTDPRVGTLERLGATADLIGELSGVSDLLSTGKAASNILETGKAAKKQVGSYTITFESGKRYHGKGPLSRSRASANRVALEHEDPAQASDWTPAAGDREAFMDEARRIRDDSGTANPENYNKINSPGEGYLRQQDEPR